MRSFQGKVCGAIIFLSRFFFLVFFLFTIECNRMLDPANRNLFWPPVLPLSFLNSPLGQCFYSLTSCIRIPRTRWISKYQKTFPESNCSQSILGHRSVVGPAALLPPGSHVSLLCLRGFRGIDWKTNKPGRWHTRCITVCFTLNLLHA